MFIRLQLAPVSHSIEDDGSHSAGNIPFQFSDEGGRSAALGSAMVLAYDVPLHCCGRYPKVAVQSTCTLSCHRFISCMCFTII